ncbi:MAG: sulfotransferase family protein [bacterium]
MNQKNNDVVLVLGMHRSGTSAVTGLLSHFGAGVPLAGDTPISKDNPKGHWEHREINQINDQILRQFGQTWTTWQSINLQKVPAPLISKIDRFLLSLIDQDNGRPIVLKDPRFCILLPLWLEALDRRGLNVKLIFCIRHPDAVARSLLKRNQLCYERGLLLWLYYNLKVTQAIGNRACHKLLFPSWLNNPRELHQHSQRTLSLCWPKEWDQCSADAKVFVDQGLVHNEPEEASDHPLLTQCLILYQLIEQAPEQWSGEDLNQQIEEFNEQVKPWMNICANLVLNERGLWRRHINEMFNLINRNI